MPKTQRYIGVSVFDAAVDRMRRLYREGHRIFVSFSGGKDSGVCLELAILAATMENRLPVEVVMRDEEIMIPGTFEYSERTARRPEVNFRWLVTRHPVMNVTNRFAPYWWTFDPLLDSSQWVRMYPEDLAVFPPYQEIRMVVSRDQYPPPPGKDTFNVIGLRAQESRNRALGMLSAGGYISRVRPESKVRYAYPIYDWTDNDVWTAVRMFGWDYNHAYDTVHVLGAKRNQLRIGPPTLNYHSIEILNFAHRAWPHWFDRVAKRLPGVRRYIRMGEKAINAVQLPGETWEQTFYRECVKDVPEWIAERSIKVRDWVLSEYQEISRTPFPEVTQHSFQAQLGSWKKLAKSMFNGDPMAHKTGQILTVLESSFFRPGAPGWFEHRHDYED